MPVVIAALLASLALGEPAPAVTVPEVGPTTPTEPQVDPAVRAAKLFREGAFLQAAAAFQIAYDQTGDPALLFGRAQALRRAGDCGGAIEVFEAFIVAGPPPADIEAAQGVIAECRAILDKGEDPPPPVPVDEPVAPPPRPRPRWHRDTTGGALLGSGLVLATVGGALLGTAFARDGARTETEQAYEGRARNVRVLATTGIALLAGGGALVVGAVIRYALVAKRRPREGVAARVDGLRWRF